jgi:hypothetical protein
MYGIRRTGTRPVHTSSMAAFPVPTARSQVRFGQIYNSATGRFFRSRAGLTIAGGGNKFPAPATHLSQIHVTTHFRA